METRLTIIYEAAEEGGFLASIVEFPGVFSEGETKEEAKMMVLDALDETFRARRANLNQGSSSKVTSEMVSVTISA